MITVIQYRLFHRPKTKSRTATPFSIYAENTTDADSATTTGGQKSLRKDCIELMSTGYLNYSVTSSLSTLSRIRRSFMSTFLIVTGLNSETGAAESFASVVTVTIQRARPNGMSLETQYSPSFEQPRKFPPEPVFPADRPTRQLLVQRSWSAKRSSDSNAERAS